MKIENTKSISFYSIFPKNIIIKFYVNKCLSNKILELNALSIMTSQYTEYLTKTNNIIFEF